MRRFAFVWVWLVVVFFLPGILAAQDVKTHVDQGLASCESGHFDQALKEFNEALKKKPNDPSLYDYRGMAHRCKGMDDKAIQDFNQAMELDPKFARAYRNRGMVYFDRSDFDRSLADLKKAQSLGYKIDEDFLKMVARKAAEKK